MRKAIFFDRDGVLVKTDTKSGSPVAVNDKNNLEFATNQINLFEELKSKGFLFFLFTNQPDVARGKALKVEVDLINTKVAKRYLLDDIFVCYHDDVDNCMCRKPKNGLILEAKDKYGLNLNQSFVIGDRWRDMDAAENSNCKSVFIDHNYSEKYPSKFKFSFDNINDAMQFIIGNCDE